MSRESIENLWDRATPVAPLLDAFEAEIRKDCAAIVRAQAPKYLDNDVDVHTFHALDAAAAAIANPRKDN